MQAKQMALKNTEQITQLKKLTAELSDRMRRVNLIIYGISEDIDQRNLEQCIVNWFSEQGIELEGELERAHRLQSKRTGGEPRPVIVKFAREKTQQQVFLALKKMKELNFKGKKIFVRRDFCPETLKQKSFMKPYAQKLHQNKIKFSWIYPTSIAIFKEGKRLLARNPQEAAKLLVKLKLDTRDLEDQASMDEEEGEEGPSTRKEKRQRMHSDEGL
ncbi:hypothetical protein JRQ81_012763 [Phrynocephalus forsythii]|uniref:LINE-1 type transposase domain-containing protein 1 n=1 Tax=Phrynocephalus forsythii TaxID=171643 RepID=A0A9Q0Y1P1_9SAUR|nr:hypothetical protein JRQ81_012763 [Phrynocephalus forsythii]